MFYVIVFYKMFDCIWTLNKKVLELFGVDFLLSVKQHQQALAVSAYEGIFQFYSVAESAQPSFLVEQTTWERFWVYLYIHTPWYFLVLFILFLNLHRKYLSILADQTRLDIVTIVNFLDSEEEQEYSALDDYYQYFLYVILFIVWYYFFLIFAHYILEKYLNWIILSWGLLIVLTFFIPGFTFTSFGLAFTSYVRGSAKSKFLVIEVALDLIASLVVFIRFFVQNIRFVLIFIAFFELYEFIFLNLHLSNLVTQKIDFLSWYYGAYKSMPAKRFFFNLIWSLLYYFYYVIHLTLLYVTQVGIFLALSYWLYFFYLLLLGLKKGKKYFFLSAIL